MSRENQNGAWGNLALTMCPFFTVFPALLLLLGAISDTAKSWCLRDGGVLSLLEGAWNWCLLVIAAEAAGVILILTVSVLAALALKKRQAVGVWKNFLTMTALPLVVVCLFGGLMMKDDVFPLYQKAQADLLQAEAGELEDLTVYFAPGGAETHLPGAFDTEKNLVQRQAITPEGEWRIVYLPVSLGFEPEVTYQTSQAAAWNEENVPQYRIACTSGFSLVMEMPEKVS